jgi:hypothetical protein
MDATAGLRPRAWRDPLLWTGLGLFAFQLVMAWRFHLERTATADSAFFAFQLIDSGRPVEALGRYGSWLAQLPALLLVHLGAPVSTVLRTYSVTFVGIDVAVFLLLVLRLRDREAAFALPLVKTAAFHYTFFYAISELNQGLTLMVLAWALLKRWLDGGGRGWAVGFLLLVVWSSFHHQLLVFPLALVIAVEWLRRNAWRDRRLWIVAALCLGWFAVRILLFTRSSYEAQRMPSVPDLLNHGSDLGSQASTQHLLRFFPKFKALLLLVLAATALAIQCRAWTRLLTTVAISTGFLVLVLVTDREGGSPNIYENYYTVLGFFWSVLLASVVLRPRVRPALVIGAQAVVLVLGCLQVWRAHDLLTAHVRYAERITTTLRERGIHKALASPMSFPYTYAWGEWPLSMETLLVSAARSPGEAVTVFATWEAAALDSVARLPATFLGPTWHPTWFTTDHFPKAQFRLPRQPYAQVNTVMPDSVEARFRPEDVILVPVADTVTMAHDPFTVLEVRITNNGSDTLRSLLADGTPMRLSYHLVDAQGRDVLWDGPRTSLEVDLPPGASHVQGVAVKRPDERGTCTVKVDLVSDGRRWWGIDAPVTVVAGR